jgi:hypothetical protein
MNALKAWGLALLIGSGGVHAGTAEVFRNDTAGLQLTKPDGWVYLTAAQNRENLGKVKLDSPELQAALQKYASAPLLVMAKYKEPYADANPSFKVALKPYGNLKGMVPLQLLGLILPQLRQAFGDAEVVQPPVEVTVAGVKSAYARLNYTMANQAGETFPLTSEMWIVPHGDYFFVLGAGTRTDESNGRRSEIDAIIKSIKLAH